MSTVKERVALGVAWLNENYPDWRERIDPATLRMSDACRCILGQVEGSFYHIVVDVHGICSHDAACETLRVGRRARLRWR